MKTLKSPGQARPRQKVIAVIAVIRRHPDLSLVCLPASPLASQFMLLPSHQYQPHETPPPINQPVFLIVGAVVSHPHSVWSFG